MMRWRRTHTRPHPTKGPWVFYDPQSRCWAPPPFYGGIEKLLRAWKAAEYSRGSLIPLQSGFLFLRQMKAVPAHPVPISDRWQGIAMLHLALAAGLLWRLAHISDAAAYALIIRRADMAMSSFGRRRGLQFWPPMLHCTQVLEPPANPGQFRKPSP